ncbi:hypothetical protein [Neobacillus sp. YIM B06451]|uniref:hypothetical protein n=1 Tax=Neobacillus sp. YIM B06451 TaxID=3070994 RepID=UPI002930DF28|nr:hypothetical protein [Neobacillus sp. YIM B06451]
MTLIHVINYTIPIAFMIFFGFLLDRMCRPSQASEETEAHLQDQAGDQPIEIRNGVWK